MRTSEMLVPALSWLVAALLCLVWGSVPAAAQDQGPAGGVQQEEGAGAAQPLDPPLPEDDPMMADRRSPGSSEWEFVVVPYLYAASLDMDVGVNNFETSTDASFGDLWDVLDFGGSLYLEAVHDRWTFFADGTLMMLENEEKGRFTDVEVDIDMVLAELGAAYRFGERSLAIEPLAGARYNYMAMDIDFDPGPSGDGDRYWLDPFVGARFTLELFKRWTLMLRGDLGGFGLGEGSDVTIHALGTVAWEFAKGVALIGGYRHYDIDYDHDDFLLDGIFTGPVVGLGFRF